MLRSASIVLISASCALIITSLGPQRYQNKERLVHSRGKRGKVRQCVDGDGIITAPYADAIMGGSVRDGIFSRWNTPGSLPVQDTKAKRKEYEWTGTID